VDESGGSLKDEDFKSYYSETKPLVINQEDKSIEKNTPTPHTENAKKERPAGHRLEDFTSIREDISIGHSSMSKKAKQQPSPSKACQFPS
jgi:hypothetical protein